MLPSFLQLYKTRPIRNNQGGMRLDHSFALYYTLQHVSPTPKTVIESGAFKGHGTWLIRQALPQARIISLDPNPPLKQLEGIEYLVGKDWVDLAKVDWKSRGVDPETTVVFIDDHQSAYRRALLELKPQGFRRFMIDDNYPFGTGDNMSFKWTCELLLTSSAPSSLLRNSAPAAWPGVVPDNFNRQSIPVTWEQHLRHPGTCR